MAEGGEYQVHRLVIMLEEILLSQVLAGNVLVHDFSLRLKPTGAFWPCIHSPLQGPLHFRSMRYTEEFGRESERAIHQITRSHAHAAGPADAGDIVGAV